jgi:hypothetical protein
MRQIRHHRVSKQALPKLLKYVPACLPACLKTSSRARVLGLGLGLALGFSLFLNFIYFI